MKNSSYILEHSAFLPRKNRLFATSSLAAQYFAPLRSGSAAIFFSASSNLPSERSPRISMAKNLVSDSGHFFFVAAMTPSAKSE